jgi:glycosyltransferase involved in cell wall biosynthesis
VNNAADTQRPRIAWWSPWPPSYSGVAEYSRMLVAHLRRLAEVRVFVEDALAPRVVETFPDAPALPASAFQAEQQRSPFDVAVFHLGNQAGHAYMADALFSAPCRRVGVFHDGSLYHLYEGISRYRLIREIAAEEGWSAAWRAWRHLRQPGSDSYHHPLLRRAAGACDQIIVHSQHLAGRVRAAAPDRPIAVLPFGCETWLDDGGLLQRQARRIIGLPQDALIFGVFGHITAAKRVDQVIEAFVQADLPGAWLYVVGEVTGLAPPSLRRWATDPALCTRHRIRFDARRRPAYLSWATAMHAVDAGVSLRFPTTGESSAVVSELLGMGKPCIVSDIGALAELPDDCTIKVPVDDQEIAALQAALRSLTTQPDRLAEMSRAARAYAQKHTWDVTARMYLRAIWGRDQCLTAGSEASRDRNNEAVEHARRL